ncbi:hypothetical protein PMZ80_006325 [Knufia obscura]|uniref:Uncharacterized protein n=2 Tax=Knufia TaxID=430999 RepID=A0AAN8F8X7_9EURO|nr:hypothetical protein PMZ80_006325 [Knufia obscura]KAK5953531.1 hypothetical protein OHC33_005475 [Knufia fluminis]
MEEALKERKLGSASARRQRMQERQKQKDLMYEQREERRRRQIRYSEIYNTDSSSNTSRSNTPENDSAADTPSESSVQTPNDSFSSDFEIKLQTHKIGNSRFSRKEEEQDIVPKPTLLERRRSRMNTSKPAVVGASLNRPCDFRYDRFSTIIEPAETEHDTEDESSLSSADDEDDYSPIEVATPVALRMPTSRPSVISVAGANTLPGAVQRFSVRNISTIMVNPPKPAVSRLRQAESISETRPPLTHKASGFPASEAKPLDVVTPSSESVLSLEPSSTRSLSPERQEITDTTLKKKSSTPMLGKLTHSRMHSIKNFIKTQSISGPPPAMPQIPAAHQSRSSEGADTILSLASTHNRRGSKLSNPDKYLPPSPRRSLTEPNLLRVAPQEQRPQTARMSSQSSIATLPYSSKAIPPAPKPQTPIEQPDEPTLEKKKSFPNLRRRSGSLGQALKFATSKNKPVAPEAPLPPVPTIRVPNRDSIQPMSFSTPTPKTPRSVRKSGMMYSPFPSASQKGEPVGLGLRI